MLDIQEKPTFWHFTNLNQNQANFLTYFLKNSIFREN